MTKDESKITIRPLGDKVLIRPLSDDALGSTSPSGIIIPDTAQKDRVDRGEVVAVGSGRFDEKEGKRIPVEVKVGDTVIFQWGDKIEYNRVEYYLVGESNISAVIEK
jgi:chaperonin GroES